MQTSRTKPPSLFATLVPTTRKTGMPSRFVTPSMRRESSSASRALQVIRNMEPAWEKIHGLKFQLMFKVFRIGNGAKRSTPYYSLTKTSPQMEENPWAQI